MKWAQYTKYRRLKVEIATRQFQRLLKAWKLWTTSTRERHLKAYAFWYGKLVARVLAYWQAAHKHVQKTSVARNYYTASMWLKYFSRWKSALRPPVLVPVKISRSSAISKAKEDFVARRTTVAVNVINLTMP